MVCHKYPKLCYILHTLIWKFCLWPQWLQLICLLQCGHCQFTNFVHLEKGLFKRFDFCQEKLGLHKNSIPTEHAYVMLSRTRKQSEFIEILFVFPKRGKLIEFNPEKSLLLQLHLICVYHTLELNNLQRHCETLT